MEENLDKNNEVKKEISDNATKSNSEDIKVPKSEGQIPLDKTSLTLDNTELNSRIENIFRELKSVYQKWYGLGVQVELVNSISTI